MYTANPKSVDLERDYMPLHFSKRYIHLPHPDQAMEEHFLKLTAQQTNDLTTKHGISLRPDIRYGGIDDRQLIDVYYRGEERGKPLFVHIHGGYWQMMQKSSAGSLVAPLVARGYRVAVVGYNLCPQVTLNKLTEQIRDCLRWVFNYATETEAPEVSFSGHSAGAHLLTYLLNCPTVASEENVRLIKGIFLIAGVYDLRECWSLKSVNLDNLLSVDASNAAELSPLCWSYDSLDIFKKLRTPIHVLAAAYDSETFVGHSHALAQLYKKLGLNVCYKLFENYDHCDIVEEGAVEGTEITNYLTKALGK